MCKLQKIQLREAFQHWYQSKWYLYIMGL